MAFDDCHSQQQQKNKPETFVSTLSIKDLVLYMSSFGSVVPRSVGRLL